VDKDQFIKVLHHYSGSSVEEAQEVLSLKESYPYSQLLHTLSARVTKDHGFSNQGGELQLAAVYAADRAVLKEIMYEEPMSPLVEASAPTLLTVSPIATPPIESQDPSDDVAEEVLHDLERLNELKHNFEMMFVDQPETEGLKATVPVSPVSKVIEVATIEVTRTVEPPEELETKAPMTEEAKKESGKSKKERIIALAKALEQKNELEAGDDSKKGKKKIRKHDGEELIDEIVSTKEELEPESEKQKEQIEMIDQFIKIQPTITNSKDKPLPPPIGDLATTKTGEFGDNIVSETLVEILIKQGKKDRAIEVLKKLIWKFPQKKAYFAAQIEDLRK
jgi:hypothetical protein